MTPAARLQAAIEILDAVIAAARGAGAAADTIVARYFAGRRYAGAKDRRAVRDLVYAAIRRAGELPASGRAALLGLAETQPGLGALFGAAHYGPAAIEAQERGAPAGIAPAWLLDRLAALLAPDELPALLDRAPLDLRANTLKADRATLLAAFPDATPGHLAPHAVRLAAPVAVERLPDFAAGLFEVQDEGSQLVAEACAARPGMTVVDLCAGAGGKTLALAAAMADRGRLIACDTDRTRLARLAPRAARAGVSIAETLLLDPGREAAALASMQAVADVVLVDAPCSGSGTWRRNPEARWRLTPARLDRLVATQAHVLALAAALVKPGGALVYAVCSLLAEEGPEQVARFVGTASGWTIDPPAFGRAAGPGRLLTPARDGTDGFFVARLHRPW